MFRQWQLSAKILGAVVLVFGAASLLSFWITQNRINRQDEDAFRDKLRQISGMASAARTWYASNIDIMVPTHEFKHLEHVPVEVAMKIAEQYAEKAGMKFRTPSLRPRNPKNEPTEFERT
jgi:methyl-accepting chemotaxis protein